MTSNEMELLLKLQREALAKCDALYRAHLNLYNYTQYLMDRERKLTQLHDIECRE